ncbi:Fe2OG dioxygenase domain-containing protein [Plasmodiophora brassicae]
MVGHLELPEIGPDLGKAIRDAARNYECDGYAVLPAVFSKGCMEALRSRMMEIVGEFCADQHNAVPFSTDRNRDVDEYFLSSSTKIHCFLEKEARGADGKLKQATELSVNKTGHAIHEVDDQFKQLSDSEIVKVIVRSCGYKKPAIPQSMYIFKPPGIGGEVTAHQDSTYLYTDPPSTLGIWISVDEATVDNGCLYVIPGSHKWPIHSRFVRTSDDRVIHVPKDAPQFDLSGAIAVPVPAGSIVLIHGALVHFSYANRSQRTRHAYTLHVIEQEDTTYSRENWLQRPDGKPFYPVHL